MSTIQDINKICDLLKELANTAGEESTVSKYVLAKLKKLGHDLRNSTEEDREKEILNDRLVSIFCGIF